MASSQPVLFQGGGGRRTIHLPSLEELDAVQMFSVAARLPGRIPCDRSARQGDIFSVMDVPGIRAMFLSGVIYDRNQISAASIGGLLEGEPVSMASNSNIAVLVDLSGYGLEGVLGLHFYSEVEKLPDFAADFTLIRFHQEHIHSEGAVAIHAGPGIPYQALMLPVPGVEDFHHVGALDPVLSVIEHLPTRLIRVVSPGRSIRKTNKSCRQKDRPLRQIQLGDLPNR
ncbi:hypothetical protein [Arthrobacter sp. CG_A4]|uniref:hypothetical protein n=1 Tax=Arthrobacter sp. CG_A4 TaxID=3071706 RepID=UPI002E07D0CA|nr:hypothetical protein [Arthrobacter sp. CG_A4]